jgi:sulfatase modifying factor 1
VSSLRLDKYLVTVGRFRRFVSAWNGGAGYVPPAGSGKHTHLNGGSGLSATAGGYEPGWVATDNIYIAPTDTNLACFADGTWTTTANTQENLPINCVTWWEAYAFCIWDGGFLPSEAEWEYAAAGGSEQREYPWGRTDPGTNNQYAIYDCHYPNDSPGCRSMANIAPVGTATLGAGRWGQLDLAGEIWEWTLDVFGPYVYRCTDCVNVTIPAWYLTAGVTYSTSGAPYGIRGASYSDSAFRLLPSCRDCDGPPAYRNSVVGFRCARTP